MNLSNTQKSIAVFLLYTAFTGIIILIFILVGKYILPLIAPFVVAWVIAAMLQPAVNFIEKHTKIPRSVSAVLILLLVAGISVLVGYITIRELINELTRLADQITIFLSNLKSDDGKALNFIEKLNSYIPIFDVSKVLEEYWMNFDENIISLFQKILNNISSSVLPFLTGTISFMTDFFVIAIILFIAVYYLTVDFKKISGFVLYQFNAESKKYITLVKNQFFITTWKYIKAYSIIVVITFAELLIAFLILGVEYPYLVATITALVDILPIIGTGTVLIPWGIFLITTGNIFKGIGLIISYVIITIVRQIIEPKIIGSYIGMHPLITLIMMYAGLKAFGILGLFAFPIVSIILKNLNDSGNITLWKYPKEIGSGNAQPPNRFSALKNRFTKENIKK